MFTNATKNHFNFVSDLFKIHHGLSIEISRFTYDFRDARQLKTRNQSDWGLLVAFSMVPGTFPNMAAEVGDRREGYSKARLVGMRTLKEVQISVQEVCRRMLVDDARSRVGNQGNRVA